MKHFKNYLLLSLLSVAIITTVQSSKLMANAPSSPIWFQQTAFEYDSTSLQYSIILKWKDGIVDANHPKAEGYYIYRSVLGHNEALEDFGLVAKIETAHISGEIFYTDKMMIGSGYLYYIKGYSDNNIGEISPVIQAHAPGAYCVNLNAEIVDILTFPPTIGIPGDLYVYETFAKHRSFRVQGLVRYTLLEFPEGMTINEKTGRIEWNIPMGISGDRYVKLKAYSREDSRAESIQEWYIRIANQQELFDISTSVNDNSTDINTINIYPNPTNDFITISLDPTLKRGIDGNVEKVQIFDVLGIEIMSESIHPMNGSHRMNVEKLPAGVYFIRIGDKVEKFVKK